MFADRVGLGKVQLNRRDLDGQDELKRRCILDNLSTPRVLGVFVWAAVGTSNPRCIMKDSPIVFKICFDSRSRSIVGD